MIELEKQKEIEALFEVRKSLSETQELLNEGCVNSDYIFKKLKVLSDKTVEMFYPQKQLDETNEYINKYFDNVISTAQDGLEKILQRDQLVNNYFSEALANLEKAKNGLPHEKVKELEVPQNLGLNYSKAEKLLDLSNFIGNLRSFQEQTLKILTRKKSMYKWLKIFAISIKVIVFFAGVFLSYHIGLKLESFFENALLVSIIVSLLCYFTIDKILNFIQEKLMFRFCKNFFFNICDNINNFYRLKSEYKILIDSNPEASSILLNEIQ